MEMKIGELSRQSNCSVGAIRFYEKEGLLDAPTRSSGNFRVYGGEHKERLTFICHARSLGMSVAEIRSLLVWSSEEQSCAEVNALLDEHITGVRKQIQNLQALEKSLVALRKKCLGAGVTSACKILKSLQEDE